MNQQMPPTEKKGLSKGCTVALIIGGVVVVLIIAVVIMVMVKGKDVAKWAFVQAVDNEKNVIMMNQIPGIDTAAVNSVADGFKEKIQSPDFQFDQIMSFQGFVQEYATDTRADSSEAARFVEMMIECYPDLGDRYQPNISLDTSAITDSLIDDNQSH